MEPKFGKKVEAQIEKEVALANAVSARLVALAESMKGDDTLTWEKIADEIDKVAQEFGNPYGIPFHPDEDMQKRMVVANGAPLQLFALTWMAESLEKQGFKVRNSWERLGDKTISIVDTEKGPFALWEYHAGERLRKLFQGIKARHCRLNADAEFKALASLRKRINPSQFDSYMLNGCFPEFSRRSGLHYMFRKGLPTLALSYHGSPSGRVIAALCLHPMGYYSGTHAGMMTPTDEVIAHLLLMRADEHLFWRKSGQWTAWDSRSGL